MPREGLNDIQDSYMDVIERRIRFLDQELAFRKRSPIANRWMAMERESLAWALRYIMEAAQHNGSR